jgi:hypothetical protein
MPGPSHGRLRQQVDTLRREFLQEGELPFADVLSSGCLTEALAEIQRPWKDRIFTPLVTLWVFLGQVLNADQSCRAAVARLIAHRAAAGLPPCSSDTGGYCQARGRLPERFFAAVARLVGRNLDARVDRRWLWKGRRVCLFDGSTVAMPDTPENRAAYPLAYNQVPGTNFAIARIGAIIALSCGAILDLGICRYAGKGQGEVSLLRRLWDALRPGDVLLGDRLMSGWVGMHLLKRRGVDTVSRLSAHRRADFRRGTRLGRHDHLVQWKKPTSIRSVDRQAYNALPDAITVREVRFRVEQAGFRTRSVVVVTTLLDPAQASKEDLASLYRARWNNELDLRSIKVVLQMDLLRCKTPELVRKESLGPRPGLQPDPHGDGPGRGGARRRAAVDQLPGDPPGAGGVPAADHLSGPPRRGPPGGTLSADPECDRRPPRRRPTRPLRAPHGQAEDQEVRRPDATPGGDQTPHSQMS